jgi:phosphate transport system substrate-binding protein
MVTQTSTLDLQRLQDELLALSDMVERAVAEAVEMLKQRDLASTQRLTALNRRIKKKRFAIEVVLRFILRAAGDLLGIWQARRFPGRCFWLGFHLILLLCIIVLLPACGPAEVSAEAGVTQASQTIENKGSDTLVNLALAWAEAYMKLHPEVRISVTGGGSGTGIAAMINGTVDIANASRAMKAEEVAAAEANGISPVEFVVALDAIAVVVHPSNPVDRLTLKQISGIYTGEITNWSEVGGEERPIVLLSRESNSGTYVYFLENVIRLGEESDLLFSPDTLLMPSSEGISSEVRLNPNAIGYDGLGYVTPDQKMLAVARDAGGPYVLPSVETVNDDTYPISRPLYIYTAGEPTGQVKAYMDWILSEGQSLVSEIGFVPLN